MPNKQFKALKTKWRQRHQDLTEKLYHNNKDSLVWLSQNFPHSGQIAASSLGALMLLASPAATALHHVSFANEQKLNTPIANTQLSSQLLPLVPDEVRPLLQPEEQQITDLLSQNFGFKVSAELSGIRLDRSFGLIGAEQHLYRYPGDTIYNHADTSSDWDLFGDSGIAPGLGAWGYFAQSKDQFTEKDKQREKYYIAVQTFLAPGFNEHVAQYRDFFKYRKMLVVNPKTGQAVVADIADAGPSPWTGKHLGGSPEVMYALGLYDGPRKGAVLFFFIDDPNDTVPLGPI